jgi:hypothetical protein
VTGGVRVLPRTVLVALVVGVGTALVSAWSPARRATRVPPVTALRGDVFALDRRESRARAALGAVLARALSRLRSASWPRWRPAPGRPRSAASTVPSARTTGWRRSAPACTSP